MEFVKNDLKNISVRYRYAWVAYIPPLFTAVSVSVLSLFTSYIHVAFTYSGIAVSAVYLIYQWLLLMSTYLFYDENGVWVFSGVLPWNKGLTGVKWENVDEANYHTGFLSWMFKSYSLDVYNRYTKACEIKLNNIKNGDKAVSEINTYMFDE